MPIVQPSKATIVKLSLSDDVAEELNEYAAWAKATRTKVVRTALQRLFDDDTEWQARKERDAEAAQD